MNVKQTATKVVTGKKKKAKRNIPVGICHVKATFNNTIITFSDVNGDVVAWSTSGSKGFKGSRKSTPFAAQVAAEEAARRAMDMGMRTVAVVVNGPGAGRESAVRAVGAAGIKISLIKDITPIPHNGCRPPKRRRV
jgi:small subunit ribosomal protein S11